MATERPRIVFDSSAWIAYFRGEHQQLKALVDDHWVVTPNFCLGEVASFLASHDIDPTGCTQFMSIPNEAIGITPETACDAAHLSHRYAVGTRLAIAIAAQEQIPLIRSTGKRLCRVEPEESTELIRAASSR